jgi:tellurite resistance protein
MNDAQRIYELMILTAWADGKIEPAEVLAIQRLVAAQPAFAAIAGRGEITRTIKEKIDRVGLEAVVRETASAIAARDDQEIAFRCCAHVLGADGELQGEEADVLGTLQELFSFSTADVKRLLAER